MGLPQWTSSMASYLKQEMSVISLFLEFTFIVIMYIKIDVSNMKETLGNRDNTIDNLENQLDQAKKTIAQGMKAKDLLAAELEASKKEIARLRAILTNTQKKAITDKAEAIKLKQNEIDTLYKVIQIQACPEPKRAKLERNG